MRLPRLGDDLEDHVIEEVATLALITKEKIIRLDGLKSLMGQSARTMGISLQKLGYGTFIEVSTSGARENHFSIKELGYLHAAKVRNAIYARSLKGRLASISRSDWIAMGALVTSVVALLKSGS